MNIGQCVNGKNVMGFESKSGELDTMDLQYKRVDLEKTWILLREESAGRAVEFYSFCWQQVEQVVDVCFSNLYATVCADSPPSYMNALL